MKCFSGLIMTNDTGYNDFKDDLDTDSPFCHKSMLREVF